MSRAPFRNKRGIAIKGSLCSPPIESDFIEVAGWGAKLVRIPIYTDTAHFIAGSCGVMWWSDTSRTGFNEAAFQALDSWIGWASDNGIEVILDTHTYAGMKNATDSEFITDFWDTQVYQDDAVRLWTFIANRYKNNPTVVGYEIFNEPSLIRTVGTAEQKSAATSGTFVFPDDWLNTTYDYFKLCKEISDGIRSVDPETAIVIPPCGLYGEVQAFNWMRFIEVDNVVYTFHHYRPYPWADSGCSGESTDTYDSATEKQPMEDVMAPAKLFCGKYNVPCFIGEFGLCRGTEPNPTTKGAYDWVKDSTEIFERNNWTWTYWGYDWRKPDQDVNGATDPSAERITALKEALAF